MTDWLRHYPFDPAPATWALNDTFLGIIADKEALWREKGFIWTLGVERELELFEPADFVRHLENRYPDEEEPSAEKYIGIDPQLAVSFSLLNDPDFQIPMRDYFEGLIDRCRDRLFERTIAAEIEGTDRESIEALRRQSAIVEFLARSYPHSSSARRDVVLAHLHLFTEEEGGFADLIEHRFGTDTYGRGWYDCEGIVEMRSPPVEGMLNTIANYHRLLEAIRKACLRAGLVPVLSSRAVEPHLHFSFKIIDEQRRINMTDFSNDEDRGVVTRAMQGYLELLHASPSLIENHLPGELIESPEVGMKPSRFSAVRVCEDNFEVRLDISHLARNLALLIAGASVYAFPEQAAAPPPADFSPVSGRFISIDGASIGDYPALAFMLNNARITDDDTLAAAPDGVHYNVDALVRQMDGETRMALVGEGEEAPLFYEQGWHDLIAKIRVTADGQFDISALDPAWAPLFAGLRIKEIRTLPIFTPPGGRQSTLLSGEAAQTLAENAAIRRALGDETAGQIAGFYTAAEAQRREKQSAPVVQGILANADDMDASAPDFDQQLWIIVQDVFTKLASKEAKGKGRADIIIDTDLFQRTLQARADAMLQHIGTVTEANSLSNYRAALMSDFTDALKRPVDDLPRYAHVYGHTFALLGRDIGKAEGLEDKGQYNHTLLFMARAILMPYFFMACFKDDVREGADSLAQAGKSIEAFFNDLAAPESEYEGEIRKIIKAETASQIAIMQSELQRIKEKKSPAERAFI